MSTACIDPSDCIRWVNSNAWYPSAWFPFPKRFLRVSRITSDVVSAPSSHKTSAALPSRVFLTHAHSSTSVQWLNFLAFTIFAIQVSNNDWYGLYFSNFSGFDTGTLVVLTFSKNACELSVATLGSAVAWFWPFASLVLKHTASLVVTSATPAFILPASSSSLGSPPDLLPVFSLAEQENWATPDWFFLYSSKKGPTAAHRALLFHYGHQCLQSWSHAIYHGTHYKK